MNDLGVRLAWSAVQVSFVLIPAAALHAFASRRSPVSGAWVAALSLALVVAVSLLSVAPMGEAPAPGKTRFEASGPVSSRVSEAAEERPRSEVGNAGWSIRGLRVVWGRFETTASAPADRCRSYGSAVAAVALSGAGFGVLSLIVGIWAVHVCRRRSRPVNDLELDGLLDELRGVLGCHRRVEVRETSELATPATAGWWRPVVLLPDDWRSWDGPERRAVLAHELAHVGRSDYLTGLVARVALALHFYHPLVHWMAARLQLEQELAADALAARFAGGSAVYVQSLSRLALRQDGKSPLWPARAFLPAKGTLIRRIAMLRTETKSTDRPWSGPRRASAGALLLAVAVAASLLHGPARGDGGDTPAVQVEGDGKDRLEPFDLSSFPDDALPSEPGVAQGLVSVRPAAIFRRSGMGAYRTMLNLYIGQQWSLAAKKLGFDPTKPGMGPLRVEMFEQVTTLLRLTRTGGPKPDGRFYAGDVFSVRTTEPVAWVALFRAFKQDLTEAREGDRVYYKVHNPALGPDGCIYCPDDRTLVFGNQKRMLTILRHKVPVAGPSFVLGKDWERFQRGLLVVAFDNRAGQLAKIAKPDEPEVVDLSPLFEHSGVWTFGLDNADELVFKAIATCPDPAEGDSTARAAETVLRAGRKAIDEALAAEDPEEAPAPGKEQEKVRRLFLDFVTNCRVEREGRSVLVRSTGLGTIASLASLLVAAGITP